MLIFSIPAAEHARRRRAAGRGVPGGGRAELQEVLPQDHRHARRAVHLQAERAGERGERGRDKRADRGRARQEQHGREPHADHVGRGEARGLALLRFGRALQRPPVRGDQPEGGRAAVLRVLPVLHRRAVAGLPADLRARPRHARGAGEAQEAAGRAADVPGEDVRPEAELRGARLGELVREERLPAGLLPGGEIVRPRRV